MIVKRVAPWESIMPASDTMPASPWEEPDEDDEVEPGVLLRPSQDAVAARDPEMRADDESTPDVYRVFHRRTA